MLRLMVLRFWPALLPILIYLAWLAYARRKAGKKGEPKPGFTDGPWIWAVAMTFAIIIGSFVLMGLQGEPRSGTYIPAHIENGELVPARVE